MILFSSNLPNTEAELEQQLTDTGKKAPRLTPTDIDAVIDEAYYHVFPGTTFTVCALKLVNGFIVTGTSAAASAENFDEEIGKSVAYSNARNKIWELEGYRLKQALYESSKKG